MWGWKHYGKIAIEDSNFKPCSDHKQVWSLEVSDERKRIELSNHDGVESGACQIENKSFVDVLWDPNALII